MKTKKKTKILKVGWYVENDIFGGELFDTKEHAEEWAEVIKYRLGFAYKKRKVQKILYRIE